MNLNALIGPAVVAAIVSGIVSFIGSLIGIRSTSKLHRERLESEKDLAERKFEFNKTLARQRDDLDRQNFVFKRRIEFAEDLLASFYKLRDVVRAVRSPMSDSEEGAGRERRQMEIESESRSRDTFYVPLARIQKNSDFLSEFFSKQYRAHASFRTNDITEAFKSANEVLVAIRVAAQMLYGNVGQIRQDHAVLDSWLADPRSAD